MEETTGFWSKKPDDMTVGDHIKFGGAVVAVCTAVPIAIWGGIAAGAHLTEKFQGWRRNRKSEKTNSEKS